MKIAVRTIKRYVRLEQWFSTYFRLQHTFRERNICNTLSNYKNYNQMLNLIHQKHKLKVWNYLATQQKKLATHKYVATAWLRTTALKDG